MTQVKAADHNEQPTIFACNMTAIDPTQRQEHIENTTQLLEMVKTTQERPDGYALEFDLDTTTLLRATQFISLERLCCPFFGFRLELKPEATTFWLGLSGPQGVKPFIEAELGFKVQS